MRYSACDDPGGTAVQSQAGRVRWGDIGGRPRGNVRACGAADPGQAGKAGLIDVLDHREQDGDFCLYDFPSFLQQPLDDDGPALRVETPYFEDIRKLGDSKLSGYSGSDLARVAVDGLFSANYHVEGACFPDGVRQRISGCPRIGAGEFAVG